MSAAALTEWFVMPRETVLAQTLVELADNLVEHFDVVDLLSLLSSRCVAIMDVTTAGVILAAPSGRLQVVASSSDAMRILELFELEAEEGPCMDCYRTGEPIINVDLPAADRWPRFSALATAEGVRSVHALPMHLRGRTIGAFNLFRSTHGLLDDADVVVAQALADVATIAILQHESAANAQLLNDQLSQALHSRVVIEQAKGRVSEATGVDMEQAFMRLRRHARNHGTPLGSICRDIAEGTLHPQSLDPMMPDRGRRGRSSPPPPLGV
jgi:GAF domain-containing protein